MKDLLLDPLVWLALGLLLTMLLSLFGRRCFRCLLLSSLSLGLLVAAASPGFANRWLATLENAYPLRNCNVDARVRPVVALGGGMDAGSAAMAPAQRLSDASKNRALAAAEIVAPGGLLLLAGGRRGDGDTAEALAMASLVEPLVSEDVEVVTEVDSRSTHEMALQVDAWFEQNRVDKDIVLVTSAWHMRRAVGVFRKRGFEVCTYGVDPLQHIGVPLTTLWPQVTALQKTQIAVHEWVGWWFYRRQGFL